MGKSPSQTDSCLVPIGEYTFRASIQGGNMNLRRCLALVAAAYVLSLSPGTAETYDTKLFAELRWRSIGPHRGGRTKAITGVASQPNVFYVGVCNGGVWRTNDYGRTWQPIFDDQPTGSIGAVAVAPSDPNILY